MYRKNHQNTPHDLRPPAAGPDSEEADRRDTVDACETAYEQVCPGHGRDVLSGEVAALRDRIAREKAEYEAWAREKAAAAAALKTELKEKKSRAGSETRFAKKDVVADSECKARLRAQTLAALRREAEALAAETAREKAAHAEIVAYLEKREGALSERVANSSSSTSASAAPLAAARSTSTARRTTSRSTRRWR